MNKHFIGSCAIVMNKKISDGNYLELVNRPLENTVRRFFQSTINYLPQEFSVESKVNHLFFDAPENYDYEYSIDDLNGAIRTVLDIIDQAYSSEIMYMSLSFIINNCPSLEDGIYYYYANDKSLLRYKEIDHKTIKDNEFEICISYFVDIGNSLFLSEARGFIEAILQIGRTSEKISAAFDRERVFFFNPNPNIFTHAIGINLVRQLLILNQCINKSTI